MHKQLIAAAILIAIATPAFADARSEADKLAHSCEQSDAACATSRGRFVASYVKAMRGDYQGQRNVAFLLSTGDDPVVKNPIQGCAWRFVIVLSGHADADESDSLNFKTECGRLDPADHALASSRAAEIVRRISR